MIRAMDLSGENELRGAIELMCCLIVAIEAGWKILGSVSLVIKRVFEGGAGEVRGGKELRSSERGDLGLLLPGDEVADVGGDTCRVLVCRGGSCVATGISAVEVKSPGSSCG